MKKVTIIIVILAFLYFIIGYLAVLFGQWQESRYLNLSAIIGGIASVSGLLSLVISGVNRKDIEQIGVDYFKDIIKTSEDLKQKENELLKKQADLTRKEKELRKLDIRKQELEYLVQKSSMILFLKEEYSRTKERIVNIIQTKELKKLYKQLEGLELQIQALDIEINESEEIEFLKKVMKITDEHKNEIKKKRMANNVIDLIGGMFDE